MKGKAGLHRFQSSAVKRKARRFRAWLVVRKMLFSGLLAAPYLYLCPLEAFRCWADCCPAGCRSALAGPDGPHVAEVARQGESHVVAEAQDARPAAVAGARDGSHAAEAARLGGLPGTDCCAAGFQAEAQPPADSVVEAVAAVRLADGPAARAWSAEFQAGDYFPAVPAEPPADGCSPAACPDTVGAAAPESGRDDWQMVDAEPGPGDRYPTANCESPEEQADYQERLAGAHYRWAAPEHCCLEHHCSAHQVEARSDCFQERQDEELRHDCLGRWADRVDCLVSSAALVDCRVRSVVLDEEPPHDCPAHSAAPVDCRVRSVVLGVLRRDYLAHSVDPGDSPRHLADLDDFQGRSAAPDECRGQSDWGHHGLRAATVGPEPAGRRGPFSRVVERDDLHRARHRRDG